MSSILRLTLTLSLTSAFPILLPFRLTSTPTSTSKLLLHMIAKTHGLESCFMPIQQFETDYKSPRIVKIAGSYPGITRSEILAVSSNPSPPQGQSTFDFSQPGDPNVGTVAIEGSSTVYGCVDPVVIISDHLTLGIPLPEVEKLPIDIVCLVDRGQQFFAERKFLIYTDGDGDGQVQLAAFPSVDEFPQTATILGHVVLMNVPWLPSMKSTKTGFAEADEYF